MKILRKVENLAILVSFMASLVAGKVAMRHSDGLNDYGKNKLLARFQISKPHNSFLELAVFRSLKPINKMMILG